MTRLSRRASSNFSALKFSNKRNKDDEDEEMDVDEDEMQTVRKKIGGDSRGGFRGGRGRGGPRGGSSRGGIANGRRGLGEEKRRGEGGHRGGGGRVMKSPRGRGRRPGR